jgi:hypothetical protein
MSVSGHSVQMESDTERALKFMRVLSYAKKLNTHRIWSWLINVTVYLICYLQWERLLMVVLYRTYNDTFL